MESATPYLEAEIRSATPQRLRKMLIDGAIRFALNSKMEFAAEHVAAGKRALLRCREVLAELLGTIDGEHELADQMREIYVRLLQSLDRVDADSADSVLDRVVDALRIERETWEAVCQLDPPVEGTSRRLASSVDLTDQQAAEILRKSTNLPPLNVSDPDDKGESTSFSCDA